MALKKSKTPHSTLKKANEVHGNKYDYSKVDFKYQKDKVYYPKKMAAGQKYLHCHFNYKK